MTGKFKYYSSIAAFYDTRLYVSNVCSMREALMYFVENEGRITSY
jgi:hypothetical protein